MKLLSFLFLAAGLSLVLLAKAQNPALPTAPTLPGSPANNPPVAAEAAPAEEADFPPRQFEARRYDAIAKKNPFLKETQLSQTQGEDTEWAKNLQLKAVTKMNGQYVVHVEDAALKNEASMNKRKLRFFRLVEGQAEAGGLRIEQIKPHRDPKLVEVILTGKNGQKATLKYDPAAIKAKAMMMPGATQQGVIPPMTAPMPMQSINMGAPAVQPGQQRPGIPPIPQNPNTARRRVILPPGIQQ